jgi:hypothetical protein
MSSEPPPSLRTENSRSRKKFVSHAFGLGFSIPLCLAFIHVVSNGLNNVWPLAVLLVSVVLTLPWSAFALVLYFLAIDGHLYEPMGQALPYIIAAIMVPGAYFNGYQFGGFVVGVTKRYSHNRDRS